MDELYSIISELTERYTGGDSTSVRYEIAEQLTEAVCYCIDQVWNHDGLVPENQEVRGIYEAGCQSVLHKVEEAQQLYSEMMKDFDAYGNRTLRETIADGMAKFFLYYDADYCPQDHILTLDYPVLLPLEELRGIDRILAYLNCIRLEQSFMKLFPRDYVLKVLRNYNRSYTILIVNLPGILLRKLLANLLLELPLWKTELEQRHYENLARLIQRQGRDNLELTLFRQLQSLAGRSPEVFQYLKRELADVAAQFVNGAKHDCLERMV
ncbi:MAG: DUF6179 domain-containing protein [Emergencia timonensis]|uniref:DUF6179 domain-containing protein n=1 Tax=Emergencia timonensis TaxID=1776384 RepID=UPI0008306974|nr:DUF6179 domain-containing protein [Emergencia timonensis]WNX89705.1 DUF6179 domain-containing protein [Emergencia timonensis]